jgi:hypothetical protein
MGFCHLYAGRVHPGYTGVVYNSFYCVFAFRIPNVPLVVPR